MKQLMKRFLSIFLIWVMLFIQLCSPLMVYADASMKFSGKNIWKGTSEILFNQERHYLFRWDDSHQNAFCIDPGNHMGSDVRAKGVHYKITDDDIPYISSEEDFKLLALICDWYDKRGSIMSSNGRYAAAQAAIWAVVTGNWNEVDDYISKVNNHVSGTSSSWSDLQNWIDTAYQEGKGLPDWCAFDSDNAPTQTMTLENGVYTINLDFSDTPEIVEVRWRLPDGWTQSIMGTTLTLNYSGSSMPTLLIEGDAPASMKTIKKNSQTLTIYIPEHSRDQAMIGGGLDTENYVYINIGGVTIPDTPTLDEPEPPHVDIYRHKETFLSHYIIDLAKYCAETGKGLEGSTFEVLESFDGSQLGNGLYGSVSKSSMWPSPVTWDGWRVCGNIRTGPDGTANHTDTRRYEYERTYCDGHPEPEYVEVPEPEEDELTGEVTNEDEIEAAEELNALLEAQWEELIALCEEKAEDGTHYHGMDSGDALEEMLEDRERTYDTFIHLEYGYTIREINARYGYILHGKHNDDESIPSIRINSSEAGSDCQVTAWNQAEGIRSIGEKNAFGAITKSRLEWKPGTRSLPLPYTAMASLEEFRFITETEAELKIPALNLEETIATSSDAETTLPVSTASNADPTASPSDAEEEDPLDLDAELFNDLVESEETTEDSPGEASYLYTLMDRGFEAVQAAENLGGSFSFDDEEDEDGWGDFDTGVSLPSPMNDSVSDITPSGTPDRSAYLFEIYDRRTEGEIHINKRDLELYNKDKEKSYGQVQGDATLEGAVYGLYAADNIVHPDGKTGTVYKANDLVAMATTDINGDASFLAYTEESDTSRSVSNNDRRWIGHPLILGSYYIREISRSEGYELSVYGINLTDSNRNATGTTTITEAGTVSAGRLYHPIDEHDGSWNEFDVTSYKTTNGYDIIVSGYPKGTTFYQSKRIPTTKKEQVVIGTKQVATGEYEKAEEGEKKLDSTGNYIPVLDVSGQPVYDTDKPIAESYYLYNRVSTYPSGTASPSDAEKWLDETAVDPDYLKDELNDMLRQTGYKVLDDTDGGGAPWTIPELEGQTNREIGEEILDWYASNSFWDSAAIHRIFEEDGIYKAEIFYDYKTAKWKAVYDPLSQTVYIRKDITVTGGAADSHVFLAYPAGAFTRNGFYVSVFPSKIITGEIPFLEDQEPFLQEQYQPLYETYRAGNYRLDLNGNRIPIYETQFIYDNLDQTTVDYSLVPVNSSYDAASGSYTIHVPNTVNWDTETAPQTVTYRAVTKEKEIVMDGEEWFYSDYLAQIKGAGVSAFTVKNALDQGSYIKFQNLAYPGQTVIYQDGNTRKDPVIVLQRVIKQAIKVTKDIAQTSYDNVNTYKIHRDPFTVLFGGYNGKKGTKTLKDFYFRLYRKQDLVNTGQLVPLEKGELEYDYELFFKDHPESIKNLAVEWDLPDQDKDHDRTTIHADQGTGVDDYYAASAMLPYGTYVLVEQQPTTIPDKHYEIDKPQEITLPRVPKIDPDGTVHEGVDSSDYLYDSEMTPDKMREKYFIRFHEETHVIEAHNNDGDFKIFKYGLEPDSWQDCGNETVQSYYHYGQSENAGTQDSVYYETYYDRNGHITDYGITMDGVRTMTGITTMLDRKFAPALVPWSIQNPVTGGIINDNGDIGNRNPGLDEEGNFNYVAYASADMENRFYSSKIRIEKLDSVTGENIIHDGALFKIYAAKRDLTGVGATGVAGTGKVLYKTATVTGTRAELEARGDVDGIHWNGSTYEGTVTVPDYDESEKIIMQDTEGNEVGIFKAYSTIKEVVTESGKVEKIPVGYIETYQPLGAGVYVLVEVQAPDGYLKSKPVAFEVYSDKVDYYEEGNPSRPVTAEKYQYAIPVMGEENKYHTYDVNQIKVKDYPSQMVIHKVEDGDSKVGDTNALDDLSGVNDKGDLLTYQVRGRKEYLEARGDVETITWDPDTKEYYGTVTKTFQEWSEVIIRGTEAELLARPDVKVLYELDGSFSGKGILFRIPVEGAALALYKGLEVKRTGKNQYQGVSAETDEENGTIIRVTATETGSRLDITTNEKDSGPAHLDIWDTEEIKDQPVDVYFYDLETTKTEPDPLTGELYVLDGRGNRICYADSITGMAYVYDDYGKLIVYPVDEEGEKQLVQSIQIHSDGSSETIYTDLDAVEDENGLPIYYKDGHVTWQDEVWTTPKDGTHTITRLPFGAYILEETDVPFDQGYVQSEYLGIIFRESKEIQDFFLQNEFTKVNIAKLDIDTRTEIQDAKLTLYRAERVEDDIEEDAGEGDVTEEVSKEENAAEEDDRNGGYHLVKGDAYAEWISGYQYDDDGNPRFARPDEMAATSTPHWIDHIPAGYYILEETVVPYEWGYVQSPPVEILVKETGDVQTFVMEDDYTALEIKKTDSKTGEPLDEEHKATLSLYRARLDESGRPIIKQTKDMPGRQIPLWEETGLVATWKTSDGQAVLETGRGVTDEYGVTRTVYDYEIHYTDMSEDIRQARYYITETGSTRFEYLPVGFYVLLEEFTPEGYATADPMLITVEDRGHAEATQEYAMEDHPLTMDFGKVHITGGKEVDGAKLEIHSVDEYGIMEASPSNAWISGRDGSYTEEEQEAGLIPNGFEPGDLKPHRIEYLPAGDYVLIETTTPYGFLQSVNISFTVMDTGEVQYTEMIDEIPDGRLIIEKTDSDDPDEHLAGAEFTLTNKDTGEVVDVLITDETGCATSSNAIPIGRMNEQGKFQPFTYQIQETDAPMDYMLNPIPHEFQFQYEDELTPDIYYRYVVTDDKNQVRISKKNLSTREELPGAELLVAGKYTKNIVDHWISTEQPHYINGITEGTYLLIEIKTPGLGYALAETIEFTVEHNMTEIQYLTMYDEPTKISVEKIDGTSGLMLAGAKLSLSKTDGTVVDQWITADIPHMIYGLEPGEYIINELEAPSGYKKGVPLSIHITSALEVQNFQYRNFRIQSDRNEHTPNIKKPDIPDTWKIGLITVEYTPSSRPHFGSWQTEPLLRLPKLGDEAAGIAIRLFLIFSSLILIAYLRRRKEK